MDAIFIPATYRILTPISWPKITGLSDPDMCLQDVIDDIYKDGARHLIQIEPPF